MESALLYILGFPAEWYRLALEVSDMGRSVHRNRLLRT